MNDDDFLVALQAAFDANDPSDGIDRADGYGRDHRIESVRVVESDDGFDDLEVRVRTDRRVVTARVLFDSPWRAASGLDEVGAYAAYVAARWSTAADVGQPAGSAVNVGQPEGLEQTLKRGYTDVSHPAPEIATAVDAVGEPFSVHATEQEWHDFLASHGPAASATLDTLITGRWDDESHIVYFRGAFHLSIRAELPPVRSMLLRGTRVASAEADLAPER